MPPRVDRTQSSVTDDGTPSPDAGKHEARTGGRRDNPPDTRCESVNHPAAVRGRLLNVNPARAPTARCDTTPPHRHADTTPGSPPPPETRHSAQTRHSRGQPDQTQRQRRAARPHNRPRTTEHVDRPPPAATTRDPRPERPRTVATRHPSSRRPRPATQPVTPTGSVPHAPPADALGPQRSHHLRTPARLTRRPTPSSPPPPRPTRHPTQHAEPPPTSRQPPSVWTQSFLPRRRQPKNDSLASQKLHQDFLYLISRTGVTGAREAMPEDLPALVRRARAATRLPLAIGFGISLPGHVSILGG